MSLSSLRWTRAIVALAAVLVALGVVACGGSEESDSAGSSEGSGTGKLEGDGKDMVLFTMTASNVYGANQIAGAKKEAAALGYKLKVFQNNFSQPEQDQQVQQYVATGAKPAALLIFPWVADAAVNAIRQLSTLGPVIMLTQEPNEQSAKFVKAYAGANQQPDRPGRGRDAPQGARRGAQGAGMKFHSKEGNLLVFQHPEGEKTGVERWKGFEKATEGRAVQGARDRVRRQQPRDGLREGQPGHPEVQGPVSTSCTCPTSRRRTASSGRSRRTASSPARTSRSSRATAPGASTRSRTARRSAPGIQSGAIEGALGVRTAAQLHRHAARSRATCSQFKVEPTRPSSSRRRRRSSTTCRTPPAIGAEGHR